MTSDVKMNQRDAYCVVHPLDDIAEEKCSTEGLGLMKLSPAVKYSLLSLRLYLIFMVVLVAYRALSELGVF
jgi:hypothetical protein